jgi:hypothetical protein
VGKEQEGKSSCCGNGAGKNATVEDWNRKGKRAAVGMEQ